MRTFAQGVSQSHSEVVMRRTAIPVLAVAALLATAALAKSTQRPSAAEPRPAQKVSRIAGPNLPTGRLLNGMRSDYGVPISGNPRTLLYKYASWKESLPPCA